MNNVTWMLLLLAISGSAWSWDRHNLANRLRVVEIKLAKLMQHVGFEADMTPEPPSQNVIALARTPKSKIAAIKAYREQTGAELKEAKQVIEAIERGAPPSL
jgi:ribosomal protein L7/L12